MTFDPEDIKPFIEFERNGWEKASTAYHDHWGGLSAQSALPMLRAAGVKKEHRVLDVASGAGYVAAAATGLGAISIGMDFAQSQVDLARKVFPNTEFTHGDAQDLPFDDLTFDAVVMGFGMNHLPSPEKAAQEAHRVLKPGGAFAFSVWASPKPGEGFGVVLSAIEKYGVPDRKLPAAPPYFRFADPAEVLGLLEPAGFTGISTEVVPQFWRHKTPNQVFDAFNKGAVRATAMLRSQPDDIRELIREAVRAGINALSDGSEFVIPVPAALSVGFKPG